MRKPILTIFYQFNPWEPTIGGIQTLIGNFIKYAPHEFELQLVGTGNGSSQKIGEWREAEFAGKRIRFLPILRVENDNVRGWMPTTVKYTAAMLGQSINSDFMHFHRLEPTLASLKWSGDKTLFVHNDIQTQIQGGGDKKAILWRKFPTAYFALERFLINQFNQVLSCNTKAVEMYQKRYPLMSERVQYIRNTFDSDTFFPLALHQRLQQRRLFCQEVGLAEDTKFILFAGRLHPQKDPILLVNSLAALKQPNTHLLIAGDGELNPQVCAEITKLELTNRVTILGATKSSQLARLYQIASVFVLTSVYEGLPLVVLEALASGTPIVTTDCGETPEFLNLDSGIVCRERSAECVADALARILQHPEDYPSHACVRTAAPYSAAKAVAEIYMQMLHRWDVSKLATAVS